MIMYSWWWWGAQDIQGSDRTKMGLFGPWTCIHTKLHVDTYKNDHVFMLRGHHKQTTIWQIGDKLRCSRNNNYKIKSWSSYKNFLRSVEGCQNTRFWHKTATITFPSVCITTIIQISNVGRVTPPPTFQCCPQSSPKQVANAPYFCHTIVINRIQ